MIEASHSSREFLEQRERERSRRRMGTRRKIEDLNDGWVEGDCNDGRQTQNQRKAEKE